MKTESSGNEVAKKSASKLKSPYMSKAIYKNYAKGMKERNQKRKGQGLAGLRVRSFEEWSEE